ncbi:MAG: cbb3-type cytochrome oxidase assembly protein CcoS [Parvularcula sp.]
MTNMIFLIPVALAMGGLGVAAFLWALRTNQFEDPKGAAERILLDDDLEDHAPADSSGNKSR